MKQILTLIVTLCAFTLKISAQVSFTPSCTAQVSGSIIYSLDVADVNGDGKLDLAFLNYSRIGGFRIDVFTNDGLGGFKESVLVGLPDEVFPETIIAVMLTKIIK